MNDHRQHHYTQKSETARKREEEKKQKEMAEINRARVNVESQRQLVESTLDELESKVYESTMKVKHLAQRAEVPIKLAKRYPLANAAIFMTVGFAVAHFLGKKGESAAMPLGGESAVPTNDLEFWSSMGRNGLVIETEPDSFGNEGPSLDQLGGKI